MQNSIAIMTLTFLLLTAFGINAQAQSAQVIEPGPDDLGIHALWPPTKVRLTAQPKDVNAQQSERGPILGIWRLVSFEREYQATGEREDTRGKNPTGYIIFTPEGRMAVLITNEGRKAPNTDQDRAGLFNSMVAYTGRYRVDGDKWIITVDVSTNPALVGTEQTRFFRVTGDRLQEMNVWVALPDNRMARTLITYERAK